MQIYKINKELTIVCEWKKTRVAFKHEATLLRNGQEVDKTKICYLNRTWESFEFESVIEKLLDKTEILTTKQKTRFLDKISGRAKERADAELKTVAGIAKLGEIFCKTKQQKNDWKARMLKAGLENKGLIMPEDWNELSENEKEKRLNGVIGQLA